MISTRRGNFDVDSTFKINEISMSSPCGSFSLVLTSNQRDFCWEPILSYSGIVVSRSNFNDIRVITVIGTFGTTSFGNFGTTQIKGIKILFIFFKITLTKIIMPIFINKNNIHLFQNYTIQSF